MNPSTFLPCFCLLFSVPSSSLASVNTDKATLRRCHRIPTMCGSDSKGILKKLVEALSSIGGGLKKAGTGKMNAWNESRSWGMSFWILVKYQNFDRVED